MILHTHSFTHRETETETKPESSVEPTWLFNDCLQKNSDSNKTHCISDAVFVFETKVITSWRESERKKSDSSLSVCDDEARDWMQVTLDSKKKNFDRGSTFENKSTLRMQRNSWESWKLSQKI